MNKQKFLRALKKSLSILSRKDAQERLSFYSEMIDDRIEEGLSEEEAVAAVGSIREIADQIISEALENKTRDKAGYSRKLKAWEIVLLIVGSPVWFPLLIAAFAVIWSLIITLWAIELPCLIFYYISKYFFVVCKKATAWSFSITKKALVGIKSLF